MKGGDFSKLIVILAIVLNVIFAAAVLTIFVITREEPTTLISYWFPLWGGEFGLLAVIKLYKVKKGGRRDESAPTVSDEK